MPSFTGRCRARGLAREVELIVVLGLMLVGQAQHRQRVLAPARVARRKNCRGREASSGALARKKLVEQGRIERRAKPGVPFARLLLCQRESWWSAFTPLRVMQVKRPR